MDRKEMQAQLAQGDYTPALMEAHIAFYGGRNLQYDELAAGYLQLLDLHLSWVKAYTDRKAQGTKVS